MIQKMIHNIKIMTGNIKIITLIRVRQPVTWATKAPNGALEGVGGRCSG
jgi:hypothetical protein